MPLHGSLTAREQQTAFEPPPRGVRKVVVATNVAETSITIADVTHVVDCGRHKVRARVRVRLGSESGSVDSGQGSGVRGQG